jgi:hypothetical protein
LRLALAALALLTALAAPAAAEDRVRLGWGRIFNNDALGDMHDRWRTGSYAVSLVKGPRWTGRLPSTPGAVLEWRFRSEIISPASLVAPTATDRRYAGILSFGLHTHFDASGLETSLGVDLVATGPMTGIGELQSYLHDLVGLDEPAVLDDQIPDGIHPTLTAEIGHTFQVSDTLSFRPFAEGTAGVETLLRVGGDVMFGPAAQGDLMLRDVPTGQRYRVTHSGAEGTSFTLGGDIARVFDSVYLPESDGYQPTDARVRLRAGMHWQRGDKSLFYGVTWLGEEFEDQPHGQLVGSLALRLLF